MKPIGRSPLVVLIDSDCLVCNRATVFLARRGNGGGSLRFGALASEAGSRTLAANGLPLDYSESVVVLDGERALMRSAALIAIAGRMSLFWRLLARVASMVPTRLRDRLYGMVSRHRYCFNPGCSRKALPTPNPL